jgi:hypothetical protein
VVRAGNASLPRSRENFHAQRDCVRGDILNNADRIKGAWTKGTVKWAQD